MVGFGLPAFAVTLGTIGVWRTVALFIAGPEGYAGFSASDVWLGSATWFDFLLPASLVLVVVVSAAFAFLMHRTVYGRLVFMTGANTVAVKLSGVRTHLAKISGFAIGGALAGLASLVYIGQYQSARADNASQLLLLIVTAVTLGGVDIFGSRGRVIGVFLALLLLGTLSNGMGLVNSSGPLQSLVIGTLIVARVMASQPSIHLGARLSARLSRRQQGG